MQLVQMTKDKPLNCVSGPTGFTFKHFQTNLEFLLCKIYFYGGKQWFI